MAARPSARRAAARRGGASAVVSRWRSTLTPAVPHGVAASVKCRKSCSCFCREQSRQSEGIAVAMARVANAVIGKKNKTWCVYFMLAATPGRARRAVRSNAARPTLGLHTQQCGFPLSVTLLRQAGGATSPHNRSHPWRDNKVRAINRASTMKHPSLVETSGFMIVRY